VHIFTEEYLDLSFLNTAGAGAAAAAAAAGGAAAAAAGAAAGGAAAAEAAGAIRIGETLVHLVVDSLRLTFAAAFEYSNTHLAGRICILANADIFFDDTLEWLVGKRRGQKRRGGKDDAEADGASDGWLREGLSRGLVLGLLRWEEKLRDGSGGGAGRSGKEGSGKEGSHYMGSGGLGIRDLGSGYSRSFYLQPRTDSQDAWVFMAPLPHIAGADFLLGRPGSDNRLAHLFMTHGLQLANPCLHIRACHLHRSEYRGYGKSEIVRGTLKHVTAWLARAGRRKGMYGPTPGHRGKG
jgi:hypothetical protein